MLKSVLLFLAIFGLSLASMSDFEVHIVNSLINENTTMLDMGMDELSFSFASGVKSLVGVDHTMARCENIDGIIAEKSISNIDFHCTESYINREDEVCAKKIGYEIGANDLVDYLLFPGKYSEANDGMKFNIVRISGSAAVHSAFYALAAMDEDSVLIVDNYNDNNNEYSLIDQWFHTAMSVPANKGMNVFKAKKEFLQADYRQSWLDLAMSDESSLNFPKSFLNGSDFPYNKFRDFLVCTVDAERVFKQSVTFFSSKLASNIDIKMAGLALSKECTKFEEAETSKLEEGAELTDNTKNKIALCKSLVNSCLKVE